jgi:hypothetical protein
VEIGRKSAGFIHFTAKNQSWLVHVSWLVTGSRERGARGEAPQRVPTSDIARHGRGHVLSSLSGMTDLVAFCCAVCDPKSLLYLFGMQLDYSDALIGGGFNFQNPNASSTCGCGKSFAA